MVTTITVKCASNLEKQSAFGGESAVYKTMINVSLKVSYLKQGYPSDILNIFPWIFLCSPLAEILIVYLYFQQSAGRLYTF